jgi:Tfp pilus assembly protein PilO
MGQSIKTWIGAAVVVAVLIAIAGWFLLISPTRTATADARANIDSEASRTVTLTQALNTLKTQYANLDATRASLAQVSVQVPTKADDSNFRRVIAERAASAGVTVVNLNTGAPVVVTPPAAKSGGSSTSGKSGTSTATPSPSASPSAAPSTGNGGASQTASGQVLVGLPLEITVVGNYGAARAFIASLQGVDGRLFLIYGLNLVSQPDSTGNGGRPTTVKGDVELSIQGYLLVLTPGPDDAVKTPGATPSPKPSPTASPTPSAPPLPSTERNPFAPIA